ncbi:MAG: ABC transporter ATP-binding protein [Gammaproteobacteria bacterium]|nr:ABC transporter ATP-binding protein [Gammaproteobacteria bacterium]
MSLLCVQNLSLSIANKKVCDSLNIEFEAGQSWGVLGRNGVGKTTLLHSLCHLRTEYSGDIMLQDKNLQQYKRSDIAKLMGIQLQHNEDPFPSSVFDTVLTGRHPYIANWQWENEADICKAKAALDIVEMTELAERSVNQLSGGERQRVSLATLITQDPKIFLLDEPNSHLDLNYQISLLDHFTSYSRTNERLLIMNLHDINLASRFCSHLLLLTGDGHYLAGPVENILTADNLELTFRHPIEQIQSPDRNIYLPA